MKQLVVLISNVGQGSNLKAIIAAINSKKIKMHLKAVLSDTKNAAGLKYAKENKIPTVICKDKKNLLKTLNKIKTDYIALAGWKQVILDEVIDAYPDRILNLHPGLIPDTLKSKVSAPDQTEALWNRGMLAEKAIQNYIDKKSTYAGSSIHFLTGEFDFGPVLFRTFEKIKKRDTVESLYKRLKKKEHLIYTKALKSLESSKIVMVIDGGGRGSVLAKKYLLSKSISKVLAVSGNDLMLLDKKVQIFPDVKTTDTKNILKICRNYNVDLIDVAQDDAVAAGVTDILLKNGFKVFGPTKAAGQIEWDKSWSKKFMKKNKIPTANFKIFKSQKSAIDFIKKQKDSKWYIKASGLAAGKGAIFAKNNKEALEAIHNMKSFGKAGETFVVEECLEGEEFSSFAAVSGKQFVILGHAQDHKTVFDNNEGPNTGGMGCSSPPIIVTTKIEKQIKEIYKKTISGLVKEERPYLGILYLGGIIDKNSKVSVIEFNARWGDPEAQVIVPSIKNDFFEMEKQITDGKIKNLKIKKDNLHRVVIAATSKGYPIDYSKVVGKKIKGMDKITKLKDVQIFGAGVKKSEKNFFASGGRLFYIMAKSKNVAGARKIAYNALSLVSIAGGNLHYRKDIGYKDLKRS